jgi:hypothetical protein
MKRIFLLIIITLPVVAFAQEKDIYDTAAEKLCQYLNTHAPAKINSEKDAELLFSQGFLETCMPLVDRLLAKEGLTSFDNESGLVIGKKVGIKLAGMCPKYLEIMRPVMSDQLKKDDDTETGTLKGTIIQVYQDGYTFLKVKTSDGTVKRAVWLSDFDDAENFNNNPQKLLNKKVELKWKAAKLYYFKSNSFSAEKIITGAKIN